MGGRRGVPPGRRTARGRRGEPGARPRPLGLYRHSLVVANTREAFRRYARYWFDAFDVVGWSDERIEAGFIWEGIENLAGPVERGTGVIDLPHMGNWDAAGRAMEQQGLPVVAVAERLRPDALYRLFLEHRQSLGMEIFGLGANGHVGRSLANRINAWNVIGAGRGP